MRHQQTSRLYFCDHFELPLPAGHRFPLAKYRMLREELARDSGWTLLPAPLATREDVELVHGLEYVDAFITGTLSEQAIRRIGFPWSDGLVTRTLASAGSTLAAARAAADDGWSGTLAGGTHHAFRDEGSGYCVFNDLAIAVAVLRREGLAERVAILDLDVHQGDGTASIFADDPNVLTVSVHGRHNFPFRKQVSSVDIALEDGSGDQAFLEAVDEALGAFMKFGPDFLLYQSGVDGLHCDRLGRLSLTHEGLLRRDEKVLGLAAQRGVPTVVTLGGGYSEPIEETVRAHANTYRTAAATFSAASKARESEVP